MPEHAAAPTEVPLRDLDDAQFRRRYGCDRFTATVLANRLRHAASHMSTGLVTNAFSLILRDAYDFGAALIGGRSDNYPLVCVSDRGLASFWGSLSDAVRNAFEEFGVADIRPGDVLMANDPYRGGTHVNDLCQMRPVFHGKDIIGILTLKTHMIDMGGIVPGGYSGTKRDVYENGLVIPPTLLYRGDKPVKSAFSLILDNARYGSLMLPDIQTIFQCLRMAEGLVCETVERYGVDAYLGTTRYVVDVAAERMRLALEALPDGVYVGEDGIDCDGAGPDEEYRVKVSLRKAGGRLEADFSGTSRQARTSVNCAWPDVKTGVVVALKFLLDPHTPFNSGALRPVDLVIPQGTFISARPPFGAVFAFWEGSNSVMAAVFNALSKAVGERAIGGESWSLSIHNANGITDDGQPWISQALAGGTAGPWGGTVRGDGDSYSTIMASNILDASVEAMEADAPLLIMRKEYTSDTAGPGKHRGGAAVVKDSLWRTAGDHYTMLFHARHPSGVGVFGGRDGSLGAVWLWDKTHCDREPQRPRFIPTTRDAYANAIPIAGSMDAENNPDPAGKFHFFGSRAIWQVHPNATWRYLSNGGGGWGDPLERDPQAVMRDVRDGYVTIAGAAEDYAVVITGDPDRHPEGVRVDEFATAQLRTAARAGSASVPDDAPIELTAGT